MASRADHTKPTARELADLSALADGRSIRLAGLTSRRASPPRPS